MWQRVFRCIAISFFLWSLSCFGSSSTEVLRVGVYPFKPLNFTDYLGAVRGLNPELLQKIVKDHEGRNLLYVPVSWTEGLQKLQTEEIDLMMSVAYTPARALTMDYNQSSVLDIRSQVFVAAGSVIHDISDLNGKRVGVMLQDLFGVQFAEMAEKSNVSCELVEYDSHADIFEALHSGEVDAGVAPIRRGLRLGSLRDIKDSGIEFPLTPLFFACKKGMHAELLSEIDSNLNRWKASENSYYYKRLNYWLNRESGWMEHVPLWLWLTIGGGVGIGLLLFVINRVLRYQVNQRTCELRNISARQVTLLASIPDIILEVDDHEKIIWTNEAGCAFYGPDVVGQKVANFTEGNRKQRSPMDILLKVECGQEALYVESCQRRCDGERRLLAFWCRALRDETGCVTGGLATARDITEQNAIEAALHKSEERYALSERAVNDALWDYNLLTDDLYCSSRWGEIFGYSENELPHTLSAFYDLVFLEDKPLLISLLRAHFEENKRYDIEFRMRHRDGRYRWVHSRGEVLRDEANKPVRMVGAITDISDRKRVEAALQESAAKCRELAENTESILWEYDILNDKWIYIAPQVERILGYAPGEWTDFEFWAARLHGKDRRGVVRCRKNNSAQGQAYNSEYRFRKKNGEFIWLRDVVNVKMENGVPVALRGVMFDITQLRTALSLLRDSEKKFKALYDHVPLSYQSLDGEGCLLDVNPVWARVLGYEREEVLGLRFSDFMHPDCRPLFEMKFAEFKKNGSVKDVEYKLRHKDGHYLDVQLSGGIGRNPDGSFSQTYCVFQDVTARKRAEAEKERLLTAINQAAEIVMITDVSGGIEYVNPAFETVTGYSSQEVVGRNPRFLKTEEQDASFYEKMWAVLLAGDAWSGRFVNKKKDGTCYTEEATISPVKDVFGKTVNYVAVKRNVTEEMKLEEKLRQSQKMQSIGQLVGGVAHDFNNLLQVIGGYVELVRRQLTAGDLALTSINEISKAGDRARELVQQLLVFGRQQVIDPVELDLNKEIESSQKMLARLIGEHIEFRFIAGKELGPVFADKGQISQVLMNLCVNARDAMSGGGTLTVKTESVFIAPEEVEAHALSRPGRYILLSVEDTGCGMEKAICEKVFDPFFTTKSIGKGTGLGLSTVYGIVKQNEGHIAIYSELNKGTVVKIYLPVCNRLPEGILGSIPDSAESVERGVETVLVVEDEEALLSLASCLLTDAGYTVMTAKNGVEAVRVFKEHSDEIDLVMMDVVMPRMGGKEAMRQILKLRPTLRYLFVSGYSPDAGHTDFIKEKGLYFLNKPYQSDSLLRKIREVLNA